jgi:outer membrane protein assembly factor BamB
MIRRPACNAQFCFLPCLVAAVLAVHAMAEDWPQFRGPNGAGISASADVPVEFGPDKAVAWKVRVPAGKSSPVLSPRRIYLTGYEGSNRLVVCLDRATGAELWRRAIPAPRTEKRNRLNDPAAPTPATDGENVYAFFAEIGLVSYGPDGSERWRVPLGPFASEHGMAASPIVVDGNVILLADQLDGSFIAAYRASDGKVAWKTPRTDFVGGYATPAVYKPAEGALQLIVPGPYETAGYAAATGERLWWVRGLGYQPKSVPVIGRDAVYVHALGGAEGRFPIFDELIQRIDKDHNGKISYDEAVETGLRKRVKLIDTEFGNSDGEADAEEWKRALKGFESWNALVAIRPAGRGDVTKTNVLWRFSRSLPDVPAPLLYQDVLYIVRDGGILTSLNPATGEIFHQGRLPRGTHAYYASPVAAAGKVYLASEGGTVTVVRAGPQWEVLATNVFDEECNATPALADGRVYLRTSASLYCFSR